MAMSADSQPRRMSFDRNAVVYHEGRPAYPSRVYELLADEYGLTAGFRVLEIGAGSGIASSELLARGAVVTAVEPGVSLAGLLRQRHDRDRLTVVTADFEHADLAPGSFDIAVAATSWHWLDATVAVPKAASLLRPAGALAVWWTVFGDPDQPQTEFRSLLDRLYRRHMPDEVDDRRPPKPLRTEEWQNQLQAGGWFDRPVVEMIRWSQRLTADSARALWATFPNVGELAIEDRDAFLTGVADAVETLGGYVDDSRVTVVYHTRRLLET
jgi:SAM-dependent methyltransferase